MSCLLKSRYSPLQIRAIRMLRALVSARHGVLVTWGTRAVNSRQEGFAKVPITTTESEPRVKHRPQSPPPPCQNQALGTTKSTNARCGEGHIPPRHTPHSRAVPVVGVVLVGERGEHNQSPFADHHQDTAAHVVEQVPGSAKNSRDRGRRRGIFNATL